MPYIDGKKRAALNPRFGERFPCEPGELNWVLAEIVDRYMHMHDIDYERINEVIGVLECLKLEIYRRIAGPYEDKKKSLNGEVFTSANTQSV
jgi:hypothetical protein